MDAFVKSLLDRLDDEKKPELICIMDNAINEMHNNGILQRLSPELEAKVHDPDPEVRVNVKTSIAKTIGKSCIPLTQPMPMKDGTVAFMIQVDFDPRFVNAICLCIQGGLEGLMQSGLYKKNRNQVMDYHIHINDNGHNTDEFISKLKVLDGLYEHFHLIPDMPNGKKPEKKGFWTKLFGK